MLYHRIADLTIYPKATKDSFTHISLGDLHGNMLKLIYTLIEESLISIAEDDYYRLRDIYFKPVEQLKADDLSELKRLIDGAIVYKNKAFTLIGDELADRGQNDFFTLLVLKKLHHANTDIDIMLSNHGIEFIRDYENEVFTGQTRLIADQGLSLNNLHYLIANKLVTEAEVRSIVEQDYKPMVKAIGYTLSPHGELSLFSHAPIGLETVKALAEKFEITYQDTSQVNLIHTIDMINSVIQRLFDQKKLAMILESEGWFDLNVPIPLKQPMNRLVWNRALGDELLTKPTGGFEISFVHGHIGPENILKNGEIPLPNYENLDNYFGKARRLIRTEPGVQHFTRRSSDITARQLVTHPRVC